MLLPAALDLLRVRRVVVPTHPGLFSALGLLSTDRVFYESRSSYTVLSPETAPAIAAAFEELERRLRERARSHPAGVTVRRSFDGRLVGQSWETPFVAIPDGPITPENVGELIERFHREYERRYGNRFPFIPVQGVTYRVELVVPAEKLELRAREPEPRAEARPTGTVVLRHLYDAPCAAPEYARDSLAVGTRLVGPAIVREPLSTTFVCPGQVAEVGRFGELAIERSEG
jgi:N-methylhydantoinase A